jgi:cysteine desulfurase/selenocysteine lyase
MSVVTSPKSKQVVFDPETIRRDFPILERRINGHRLVYLDNAATTQKPHQVIDAASNYYANTNANVHRGLHTLAEEATAAYEETRKKIAEFIGSPRPEQIVFTRGATESINLIAYAWGRANVKRGDRIVLTQMEHHANLVPWIALAGETGAELKYIPIDDNGCLVLDDLGEIISENTRIVSVTQMSNVLGTINPVNEIVEAAHSRGAIAIIDGAQSIPHIPVNVTGLGPDFVAFSAHKMLGPTGIGVLYGREELLNRMQPFNYGGEMISQVRYDYADWADIPHKFEGGTPNIAGAVAFAPAIDYLSKLGMAAVRQHEIDLTGHALEKLQSIGGLRIYGPLDPELRGGAVSFVDEHIHPHDLAQVLDQYGIAVRAGHHCCQPLHNLLGIGSTTRASFYIYNSNDEIDLLADGIREARRFFRS